MTVVLSTPIAAEPLFRVRRLTATKTLFWACVAIVVGLTIVRGIFITTIDLRVDEAYYWTWSKENVISYLDHPPMIAWLIRLSTSVFGDTNFGVRFPGLLAMSLMQVLLAAIVWRILRDVRSVIAVVLMSEATLAFGLGMTRITPDVALIPCELVMFWSLIRLAQSNDHRWWLVAGLFGGLAALAKYTAVLLVPSIVAFVLVPSWRKQQIASIYLWLALGIAVLVFSPVLYWNVVHDGASFRFQLDRPVQGTGWTVKFLFDFVGEHFVLIGIPLLPIVIGGTVMFALRGYRERAPIPILLSTATLFPLGFLVWHGLTARVGDSWSLFIWPMGLACASISVATSKLSPLSPWARTGPPLMVIAIASGVVFVATAQVYYIWGTANYLRTNDPIGKEAGFSNVAAATDAARKAIGARWIATTDYRLYAMLKWHLRNDALSVVQVNERRRYIGFAEPTLVGSIGLYVASEGDPDATIMAKTSAALQSVGGIELTWRGISYDSYRFQKLTNWTPVLSPPPNDPFERAHPH